MASLHHQDLDATFEGHGYDNAAHYHGIPYATITKRFQDPVLNSSYDGGKVDCTNYGPRCPQRRIDIGYLLREPEGDIWFSEAEDEFKCLNLDIIVPNGVTTSSPVPVLFWVHGGSQTVTYGSSASKLGNPRKVIAQSIKSKRPVIVVSVQYRLNIFHVGDREDRGNFGFKDLMCALEWTRRYIGGFGGDPERIALMGESAGATLVHSMVVAGAKAERAALLSGSMWLNGPKTSAQIDAMTRKPILEKLKAKGFEDLENASVEALVEAQEEADIASVSLTMVPELEDWQTKTGAIKDLIVGDCEYEGVIWRNGVEKMSGDEIDEVFSKAGDSAQELKKLYHINASRSTSCKSGALDFINDALWAMPTVRVAELYRKAGKAVYTYVFDEANPWQASARAHHAVDLLYLFEGFDISQNRSGLALALNMRLRFLLWINGQAPWDPATTFAFGPHGNSTELDEHGLAARRRLTQIKALKGMSTAEVMAVKYCY